VFWRDGASERIIGARDLWNDPDYDNIWNLAVQRPDRSVSGPLETRLRLVVARARAVFLSAPLR
jgi:hypothetical protein